MRADPGASAIDGDGEEPEVPEVPEQPVQAQRSVPLKPVPPDDDQLLAVLAARRAVPPAFVRAASNAFAWHNIDAELAKLSYDSSRAASAKASTRAEFAAIRALTFTCPRLTIELEVTAEALLGQIIPMRAVTIAVETSGGAASGVTSDDVGCFAIRPVPSGAFRLRCLAPSALDVLTSWISL
jgi:hypothetical protein